MKKIVSMLFYIAVIAGHSYAQNGLKISGEIKSGLFWYEKQVGDAPATSEGYIHNSEDDNTSQLLLIQPNRSQGRFRLNLQYDIANVGMKTRFQQTEWRDTGIPRWDYAFAYGNFINNQLKISLGKLGDSPWAAGGPEMWQELDTRIGIRFEIMPNKIPGLNIGFVLNDMDGQPTQAGDTQTIADTLQESAIGANYANDYFLIRAAYRLDSSIDYEAGDKFLYRLEERVIRNYLPGFQIWANGYWEGLRTSNKVDVSGMNWLYVQYAPEMFTAQVRFGLDIVDKHQTFYTRASFYYNLFNNLINIGVAFEFAQDFGEGKIYKDSDFLRWFIEPQIRVNLNSNAYMSFIYQNRNQYTEIGRDVVTKVHLINLRAVYVF
jgi:hypothetical protein